MNLRKAKTFKILCFLLPLALAGGFLYNHPEILNSLSFENLKAKHFTLSAWSDDHLALSILLFIVCYSGACFFALPLSTALTVLAGALYPISLAIPLVILSRILGFSLAFATVRYLFKDFFVQLLKRHLQKFEEFVEQNPLQIVLTLRLIPVFPSAVVTACLALNAIPWKDFLRGSLIAMIPTTTLYCLAGKRLSELKSLSDILDGSTLILLFALATLPWLIGAIFKRLNQ